ncbi:MAG: hypothetical protein HFG28_07455 [Eubacterium sp.]|nr:hypothetical protein [Eubacterium sp.]
MKKMCKADKKRYIVILGTIVVLCIVIMMPHIYFSIMDYYAYEREHKMEKISFELSSDVKDITMVQRMHEVLNSYYSVQNVENTALLQADFFEIIGDEDNVSFEVSYDTKMLKFILKEAGFMKYIPLKNFKGFYSFIKSKNNKGIVQYQLKGNKERLELRWDSDKQKLLYLKYRGKNVKQADEREIYEWQKKYIEYMNLSLVEDWVYNNRRMISKKAHLSTGLRIDNQKNVLELSWDIID